LFAILIIGTLKFNKNNIKTIKGKVIEFKEWGDDSGSGNKPIVKTETGKTIKISGADRDEDGIEIGQSYTFLQLFGVAVPVKNEKENSSS